MTLLLVEKLLKLNPIKPRFNILVVVLHICLFDQLCAISFLLLPLSMTSSYLSLHTTVQFGLDCF
jgi:hypothetical protein